MNEYENNEFTPEEEPIEPTPAQQETPPQQPSVSAHHGAGAWRKESPYANSPYVMNHQPRQENTGYSYQPPRQEYHYQPQTEAPVKPKKVKS